MGEFYGIRLAKAEHVFSAAHFITYEGHCERLHGHNYRVAVEIRGNLNDDSLVVDFIAVRDVLREILARLDHFVLLPTQHPELSVEELGDEVHAVLGERRWIFPRGDCRLLPVANTTAELVAAYIGRQLKDFLEGRCGFEAAQLRVELDECAGQLAIWESRTF